MKVRACLDCGTPTTHGSRCEACGQAKAGRFGSFRPSARQPVYDSPQWRRLREQLLSEHRMTRGNWCPGWREQKAHPSVDLTVDHITPLIAGGAPFDRANLQVICRHCHGRKSLSEASRRRAEGRSAR